MAYPLLLFLNFSASDKCDVESECLSFSQHMTVAGEMWEKHFSHSGDVSGIDFHKHRFQPTVVFTTEATDMLDEQKNFVSTNQVVSRYPEYNFSFITNHHDVSQNSGSIDDPRRKLSIEQLNPKI
jgi:hypothetical protein